jgi:hypothetical protein
MFKGLIKVSRERWCELNNATGTLVYYKKRYDPVPAGEISLNDPTCEVISDALTLQKHSKEWSFTISSSKQQNKFNCRSMENLREWVHAIRSVCQDRHMRSAGTGSVKTNDEYICG